MKQSMNRRAKHYHERTDDALDGKSRKHIVIMDVSRLKRFVVTTMRNAHEERDDFISFVRFPEAF